MEVSKAEADPLDELVRRPLDVMIREALNERVIGKKKLNTLSIKAHNLLKKKRDTDELYKDTEATLVVSDSDHL